MPPRWEEVTEEAMEEVVLVRAKGEAVSDMLTEKLDVGRKGGRAGLIRTLCRAFPPKPSRPT
jgi:hypothetical protein